MLQKVKKTLTHSAIYSLGNVTSKIIGIVLLPLYTRHITVAEYGVLGILETTIMILVQVIVLGQGQAYLRFHDMPDFKERRDRLLFTLFIFLVAAGSLICLLGGSLSRWLASFFQNPAQFALYFQLCFFITLLRVVNRLLLTAVRAREKPVIFATGNIIKMTLTLAMNIYFIAFLHLGVLGILYAYLIGDGVLFVLLLPLSIRWMKARFEKAILKSALVFGVPLIFSSLATMLLNTGNRYILKFLVDYHEVGLYNLGYKIAGFLNVFLIQSFTMGFLPLAYKMYGQPGDKRYFSKMLTYLVFLLCWTGLALALFSEEIVKKMALSTEFWPAYQIIPVLILSFVFAGAKSVTSLGLFLTGKTGYISLSTVLALVVSIALNFILIPSLGMMGAAVATTISFVGLNFLELGFANRFFAIPFEYAKLILLVLLATGLYLVIFIFPPLPLFQMLILKGILVLLFPFFLYPFGFYEKIEIDSIRKATHKLFKRERSA